MSSSAPIKNTVGEGFLVEETVVAWIACHLLSGAPWQGKPGLLVTALDCQTQQDGWRFDDIVIHLRDNGADSKAGCSAKSFEVFGPEGAPADFARALWQQWRQPAPTAFQPGRDRLILFSAQHPSDIREAWFGLTEEARVNAPETTADRFKRGVDPSPLRRLAFKSLVDAGGSGANVFVETAQLLQALHLIENDFQHSASQSVTQAVALCQQALADSDRSRAGELWEAVSQHVAGVRRKGGRITLTSLLASLTSKFTLKQHPDYAGEWEAMTVESRQRMESFPVRLGGIVSLDRAGLLQSITASAAQHKQLVLLGPSGNGKSVIARAWALGSPGAALWIKASDFSVPGGVRRGFGLRHPVTTVFAHAAQPVRLVLDALDKCFDDATFDEIANILSAIRSADRSDAWQVVITCCPEDWERVRRQLIRRGITVPAQTCSVPRLTPPELRAACSQLSVLTALEQRPHLRPILSWPKALDILATYWQATAPVMPWAAESDFSRWFWRSIICQDQTVSIRDRVARKVAVEIADRMTTSVSLGILSLEEVAALGELAREGHVSIDAATGTASFTHELIADWARQHELQLQDNRGPAYLQQRLHSPHWHRAVRFYALVLLEGQPDAGRWQQLFLAFNTGAVTDELAQNLLLEAPIFSIDQAGVLERLWSLLESNGGVLLGRFLRQFLRVGTIPNERMLSFFRDKSPDLLVEAATLYRRPWGPYWLGVLSFLARHAERVAALAPGEIAELCLKWLPLAEVTDLMMDEAATLAVTAARQFYQSEARGHFLSRNRESVAVKTCQALLAAAPVKPEQVTELCLKLSGRRLPDAADAIAVEQPVHRSRFNPDPGELVPWPDGPQWETSPAFRTAFMSGEHSAPLFRSLPEVGAEVMFAVLLDLPYANTVSEYDHEPDQRGFCRHDQAHNLCFWTTGPFLAFLQINPAVALPAIIKLVNFATDRAAELPPSLRQTFSVSVTVEGETHDWRGHQFSYLWHQVHVFGPRAAGCALLSLEKWLYLLMDENEPIEEHLRAILKSSRSVALAAVLICVGKKKPELFLTVLRPMLEAVDFQWIEESLRLRSEGEFRASAFYERSQVMRQQWADWVHLPHRKERLGNLALRLFLSQAEWRTMFDGFRANWQKRLATGTAAAPAPDWLPRMISQFEIENWSLEKSADATRVVYNPPASLPQPTPEETARMRQTQLLLFLPLRCEEVLLGTKTWTEQEFESWWAKIPEIRAVQLPEDDDGLRNIEDALMGIVAVAVVRHRSWLAKDPAREKEARAILHDTGAKQPKKFWFSEDDICSYKWDNFAAWAIPTFWCETPDDPELAQAIGALVLWDRYLVVSRVMAIAAEHRSKLGKKFDRLLAHALQYAPARHLASIMRYETEIKFDRNAWVANHLDKFVAGKTAPMPADWRKLAELVSKSQAKRAAYFGGMELGHMAAVLGWTTDLSAAQTPVEKGLWLNYHRQLLHCALIRIDRLAAQPPKKPNHFDSDQEGWPYKYEEIILEMVARTMARLEPGADHRGLWEPIFVLGAVGGRWIESFASKWLLEAGGGDQPAPAMIEQWTAMLDYAESSPQWKAKQWRGGARDVWNDLLGLSPYGASFWHKNMAPVVEAVRAYHERWARAHASHNYDARLYIYFLMCDASLRTRIDGLCLLHEVVPLKEPYFWEDDTQSAFATFLQLVLENHEAELRAKPRARDAFMAFAVRLTSLQHPLGSELLTLAGSRLGAPP